MIDVIWRRRSARAYRRGEGPKRAGAWPRLPPPVCAELGVEMPHVGPDRVQGEVELTGDLGSGQVGRQVAEHAHLTLREGSAQQLRGVGPPCGCPLRKQGEDFRDQGRMRAAPPLSLEEP